MTAPAKIRYPAGPEDEFDVAIADLDNLRHGDTRDLVNSLKFRERIPEWLVSEVQHLNRSRTMTPEQLASRIRVSVHAVTEHVPYGMVRPIGANDERFEKCLEDAIASGRRFTTAALPLPDSDEYGIRLVTLAANAGRIRCVGVDNSANKVKIWEPIPTERSTP